MRLAHAMDRLRVMVDPMDQAGDATSGTDTCAMTVVGTAWAVTCSGSSPWQDATVSADPDGRLFLTWRNSRTVLTIIVDGDDEGAYTVLQGLSGARLSRDRLPLRDAVVRVVRWLAQAVPV